MKWNTISNLTDDTTIAYVTIQIPSFYIKQDQLITTDIFNLKGNEFHIASGYLNLPDEYTNIIKKSQSKFKIMTGSPQANGFLNSKGVSKYIPG
jgi:CDP-diacylglycerol--glycerol-3-phosphate 3-phosphatidyltransferase